MMPLPQVPDDRPSCGNLLYHGDRYGCILGGRCEPAYADISNLSSCDRGFVYETPKSLVLAPAATVPKSSPLSLSSCKWFDGQETGKRVLCGTCKGKSEIKTYHCGQYGECTPATPVEGVACCNGSVVNGVLRACQRYEPRVNAVRPLQWSYGITTVPSRRRDLLPGTLSSLHAAGFDRPVLFVDGGDADDYRGFRLDTVVRTQKIRTYGTWVLALWELYVRDPSADRYAVFQDDLVSVRNLRQYLGAAKYPGKGYLNLYTFPAQKDVAPLDGAGRVQVGFFEGQYVHPCEKCRGRGGCSNCTQGSRDARRLQKGLGAVALVFDREAVITLLSSRFIAERPMDKDRGHRAVDGGIVTAMNYAGYREFVHWPSLVQHVGVESSMGNLPHPTADSHPGPMFDALTLIGRGVM